GLCFSAQLLLQFLETRLLLGGDGTFQGLLGEEVAELHIWSRYPEPLPLTLACERFISAADDTSITPVVCRGLNWHKTHGISFASRGFTPLARICGSSRRTPDDDY